MRHANPWSWAILAAGLVLSHVAGAQPVIQVPIDARAAGRPFPHFWEQMFGSGRAVLALRAEYRRDLGLVKAVTDFRYVRFHGILDDDVGVYEGEVHGRPLYNFTYVDQIYDGLLAAGVRPFVELSFMPRRLAARPAPHPFWYHPNVAPPKDYRRWDALIRALVSHLERRYGAAEVRRWYFEVWNEPNLDFWTGVPKQATYWQLYDHTARAVKSVDPRLRVGGPATAQTAWVRAFLRHAARVHVPVDFVSTHVYADDTSLHVFGRPGDIPRDQMVCRAVRKVHREILASPYPHLPLIMSEFNATYMNSGLTDTVYMGPWLANLASQCDGLTSMMSYWTFSDVFEEQGVPKRPLWGGFGLLTIGSVPKPAYNAFVMLHQLGKTRIPDTQPGVLITRRRDGELAVALWNPFVDGQQRGSHTFVLQLSSPPFPEQAQVQILDAARGDLNAAYLKMGRPRYPTPAQYRQLQQAARLPPPWQVPVNGGAVRVTVPESGLALVILH
ncbi:MAG: GH39 family glycosyl hydrolase [Steroidobacteraceae bacterium]